MARLGVGVYLTPFGTGVQSLTVDQATIVGDEFFAFGLTQATSGSNPTWTAPNPPFTHGLDFTAVKTGAHDGNFGTFCWMAHGAPGVAAKNTVYSFTHDASVSMRTLMILLRCKEQVLSDGIGGGPASANAGFPVTSPATIAVNFPLANPGFDFLLFNNKGVAGVNPTGINPKMQQVASLTTAQDNMDVSLFIQLASRNVAFVGTLTEAWVGTAVDGWTILAATAQLGATNTASTLTFPQALPTSAVNRRLRSTGSAFSGGFAQGIRLPIFG